MVAATSSRPRPLALWVTPVSEPGGVARHVLDTARTGIPGFRLAVLCPPGPLAEQLRAVGAAVLTGPFGPGAHGAADDAARPGPARAAAVSAATLRHAVRTLRPEVVHSHLAFADLVCAAVLRGLPLLPGVRRPATAPVLVSTEHGISGDPALYHADPVRARAMATLHARRLRLTDVRIAVSEATARAMERRWGATDVTVIRNGVDGPRAGDHAARRDALTPGGPRLLSLTRLAPEKNLEALLDTVVQLRTDHPDVRLTLAGDGPEREQLRTAVAARGLTEQVRMPGVVDPVAALAVHDVVVQLSRWENCSYTLLDAVAAGLGVVATDVGGNREILPQRCLVTPDAPDLPRRVARGVLTQLSPARRPGPSTSWPTVARTTAAVGRSYRQVLEDMEVRG